MLAHFYKGFLKKKKRIEKQHDLSNVIRTILDICIYPSVRRYNEKGRESIIN